MKRSSSPLLAPLLLLLVVQQLFTPSEADISCIDVLSELSPCLDYLQGNDDSPSSDCCDGVSSIVAATATTADRQKACGCIKSAAKKINLDLTAAQALPAGCGITLPYTISPDVDCSQIS